MLVTQHTLVGTLDLDGFSGSSDQLILALLEEMGGPAPKRPASVGASRVPTNRLTVNLDQLEDDLWCAWYQWEARNEP